MRILLSPSVRLSTLNVATEVVYLGAPDVILNVARGVHGLALVTSIDMTAG